MGPPWGAFCQITLTSCYWYFALLWVVYCMYYCLLYRQVWQSLEDMSKDEAMSQYVHCLSVACPQFTSHIEALQQQRTQLLSKQWVFPPSFHFHFLFAPCFLLCFETVDGIDNRILNFLDIILRAIAIDNSVTDFTESGKYRTLWKTSCYWAEEYATLQLHHSAHAEVKKFHLCIWCCFNALIFCNVLMLIWS